MTKSCKLELFGDRNLDTCIEIENDDISQLSATVYLQEAEAAAQGENALSRLHSTEGIFHSKRLVQND